MSPSVNSELDGEDHKVMGKVNEYESCKALRVARLTLWVRLKHWLSLFGALSLESLPLEVLCSSWNPSSLRGPLRCGPQLCH